MLSVLHRPMDDFQGRYAKMRASPKIAIHIGGACLHQGEEATVGITNEFVHDADEEAHAPPYKVLLPLDAEGPVAHVPLVEPAITTPSVDVVEEWLLHIPLQEECGSVAFSHMPANARYLDWRACALLLGKPQHVVGISCGQSGLHVPEDSMAIRFVHLVLPLWDET